MGIIWAGSLNILQSLKPDRSGMSDAAHSCKLRHLHAAAEDMDPGPNLPGGRAACSYCHELLPACPICGTPIVSIEQNVFRYQVPDLQVARAIAITPQAYANTDQRWAQETDATLELIRPLLESTPGATIVDYGVGPGRLLQAILRKFPEVRRYVAIDASPMMLSHAREHLGPETSRNVEFLHFHDLAKLQERLAPGSVDLVVCSYVLQHVAPELLGGLLLLFRRILKKDGHLVVIDQLGRAVPRLTQQEKVLPRSEAVRLVAEKRAIPRQESWEDDGIDLRLLLVNTLGPLAYPVDPGLRDRVVGGPGRFLGVYAPTPGLPDLEDNRTLHDAYVRLCMHEDEVIDSRLTIFMQVLSVLGGAAGVSAIILPTSLHLYGGILLGLSTLALTVSLAWFFIMQRTVSALEGWRQSARYLENHFPTTSNPVAQAASGPYTFHHRSFHRIPTPLLHRVTPSTFWKWFAPLFACGLSALGVALGAVFWWLHP